MDKRDWPICVFIAFVVLAIGLGIINAYYDNAQNKACIENGYSGYITISSGQVYCMKIEGVSFVVIDIKDLLK